VPLTDHNDKAFDFVTDLDCGRPQVQNHQPTRVVDTHTGDSAGGSYHPAIAEATPQKAILASAIGPRQGFSASAIWRPIRVPYRRSCT
jgi:hypothetical protein